MDTKYRLCFRYASKVVILWWLILTRTPMGVEHPELFQFDQFVLAALLLMADGFALPDPYAHNSILYHSSTDAQEDSDRVPMIELIKGDLILSMLDLNSAIETYLKTFKSNGTKQSKDGGRATATRRNFNIKSIDTMRKNMELALSESIIKHRIAPRQLMLNEHEITDVTEDIFKQQIALSGATNKTKK